MFSLLQFDGAPLSHYTAASSRITLRPLLPLFHPIRSRLAADTLTPPERYEGSVVEAEIV